jgi:very-short-patch-repair endonuclease
MAYPGEWLEGYGLAPEPGFEEPSNGELLPIGCPESLVSLELAECLIHASRNLPYRSDRPVDIPRGKSIVRLRKALLDPFCVEHYRGWMKVAEACESPVEAVAFLSLCASLATAEFPLAVTTPGVIPELPELADRMTLAQVVLQEPADDYRIDIALHFNCRLGKHIYSCDLAIECDGLEFHSSPIQRARDETKSQFLANAGFSVFRISGAEIWNAAAKHDQRMITTLRRFCGQLIHGMLPEPVESRIKATNKQRHDRMDSAHRM